MKKIIFLLLIIFISIPCFGQSRGGWLEYSIAPSIIQQIRDNFNNSTGIQYLRNSDTNRIFTLQRANLSQDDMMYYIDLLYQNSNYTWNITNGVKNWVYNFNTTLIRSGHLYVNERHNVAMYFHVNNTTWSFWSIKYE